MECKLGVLSKSTSNKVVLCNMIQLRVGKKTL